MSQDTHPSPVEETLRVPAELDLSEATLRVGQPATSNSEAAAHHDVDATLRVDARNPAAGDEPGEFVTVPARRLPLGVLPAGSVLCGDCVVRETVRPHETTRPGLYDCDGPEGHVMIKIAAAEHPPREDLWRRLPDLRHPSLLRTHRVVMEQGFYAEVQEFCEGGTLDDCTPRKAGAPLPWESIERGVVSSFLAGIAYLHANGIVHRDVKPKNLYLRKNRGKVALVIGDFDISSVIESDHTSRDTPRGAGTHYYMAPEAFPRFVDPAAGRAAAIVSPASDFYSFGVVLIELLVGTTALHSGRWSDVYDFYMGGGRLEVPTDLPPRARELIQGLLIRNRRTRWGTAEVRRWLEGQTTDVDRERIREDVGFELVRRAARPYNVFPSSPTDIPSLAKAMLEEPVLAEEELMSGDVLVNWLGELDAKLAREIRRDREQWRHHPRVAYMSALMRLDPTLPFQLAPGLVVPSWEEWENCVETWVADKKLDLAAAVSRSTLLRLEAWLRLKSDSNLRVATAISVMRAAWWDNKTGSTLTPLDVRIAWEEMLWLRDPLRPFTISQQDSAIARTPAEIAQICYGTASDWSNGVASLYRKGLYRWREGWLSAWLRQRTMDDTGQVSPVIQQIDSLRNKDELAPEAMWETVLRMLDPNLPKVPLHFNNGNASCSLIAEWGQLAQKEVRYESIGPGLPFGAWKLVDPPFGLRASPLVIDLRSGNLTIALDTRNGLEPGSAGVCYIQLEQGGTATLEQPLRITYQVKQPNDQRNKFILNGALLGAGLAGGARLVAFLCTGREWSETAVTAEAANTATANTATPAANPATTTAAQPADANEDIEPPASYVYGGMTIVLTAIIAFYIWLDALRKYARR